jgi:lipid-A-disaccharide synthase
MPAQNKVVFISTVEPSGDIFAARLALELKNISPNIEIYGIGGEKMAAAGVRLLHKTTGMGAVGLIEAIFKAPFLFFVFKDVLRFLKHKKPDLLISVDSQGFNVPLSKAAKKLGIATAYYVAPQEWLWGTVKGIKKVISSNDLILNIFKDAFEAYRRHGGNAKYCGHPLLDTIDFSLSAANCKKSLGFLEQDRLVSIFPGNRKQEIERVFPVMLAAAAIIGRRLPDIKFIIPVYSPVFKRRIALFAQQSGLNIKLVESESHVSIKASDLVISTPGTVTMECLLLGTPAVAAYRLHPITYYIAKNFLKIRLKYFTMPSLLSRRLVIPEFIQSDCTPDKISSECLSILCRPDYKAELVGRFGPVIAQLSPSGSFYCAAKNIFDLLYK